ncbi:amidohydrolase family protein [Streptomyces chartreusis]|uniref:amidohydrolase family protein n=1 Tax=Streptomyces chartreusis TaxID=1969 RepID=UPI0036434AD2
MIVDAQLHEPAVSLPWAEASRETRWDVMVELQLGYMRAVGVDFAVLHPSEFAWGAYAAARHPSRFGLVGMVGAPRFGGLDPRSPGFTDALARMCVVPGTRGLRVVVTDADLTVMEPAFAAAQEHDLPLFMLAGFGLSQVSEVAVRCPQITVVVDQIGLAQPPGKREEPPFAALPQVLELAKHPNVAIKLTGAPTLSQESYPYRDLWPHLRRLVDAFGHRRVMWGSDISRIIGQVGFTRMFPRENIDRYGAYHSYAEALMFVRETESLSAEEKRWLLGETARELLLL